MSDSPADESGISPNSLEGNHSRAHPVAWREMHRWLEKRSVQELRLLAERRKVSKNARRKAELVKELVSRLAHPERVLETLDTLEQGERAMMELVYLLAADGCVEGQILRKALLAWYGPVVAQHTSRYLENLTAQALVFESSEPGCYHLPQAVLACLESLSKEIGIVDQSLEDLDSVDYAPSLLPHAITEIWQYCRENQVVVDSDAETEREKPEKSPSRAGSGVADWFETMSETPWQGIDHLYVDISLPSSQLGSHDLSALLEITGQSQDIVLCAFHLLLELGLAARVGQRIEVNELAMDRFRRHGEMRQLQSLLSAWLSLGNPGALARILGEKPNLQLQRHVRATDFSFEVLQNDLARLRQFTARLIGLLEQSVWYSITELLKAIYALWPTSLLPSSEKGSMPPWRLTVQENPESGDQDRWLETYGYLFAAFITGPLAWLGGIRLASDRDRVVGFQLNSLGRYLCGHYPQVASHEGDMRPLSVGDDLTVRIQLGRVDAEVHDFLGQFSDLVEAESDVFHYQITPQQLNSAFEEGITLKEILRFLERVGGAPVPEPAKQALTRWYENYGSVRLYDELTVIEFADDYALQELLNTTALASAIIYELSPRMVVIDPTMMDDLMAEMIKRGYTPKLKETLS